MFATDFTNTTLTPEQIAAETQRRKEKFQAYLNSNEYQAKLIQRLKLNDAGDRNAEARAYIWQLCARPENPKEGFKFFVNNFGWTADPRPEHAPHNLPFITWEFQDRLADWFIDHVDGGRDGLIEKSRDMGASWMIFVYAPLWYWLFRDGVNFLMGSYKEDLVDNRTIDSLFGKIDYAIECLPKWMLPKGFRLDKHRTHMRLTNPVNGNVITGDTMNAKFGRGSRKTAILFDELGFWDAAADAWGASSSSTSCRIANSTPQGYNFFASLKKNTDVITLHWTENPTKDKEWYEFEKLRNSPEVIAQEIDLSYTKSREGKVYPEWDTDRIFKGVWEYDATLSLYVGWDFGKTDDTAIIWAQKDPEGGIRIIDTYRNTGKNIDFYIPFITGIVSAEQDEKYHYTKAELDIIYAHKEFRRATHFGDPAGRFQNQVSDETVFSVLKSHGIPMNYKERWKEFKIRKSAGKRLIMNNIKLNWNARTEYFEMCIMNAAYPKVRHEGQQFTKSEKPNHDWTSHYRSAFEYLALGLEEGTGFIATPRDKIKKKPRRPGSVMGY